MAGQVNPYYNPAYAEAAAPIAKALLIGDPDKAGEIESRRAQAGYYGAETALENAKTTRQTMENDALQNGVFPADTPNSPGGWAAALPGIMNAMARASIKEPANYFSPVWGMQGEAQSGASPTEALDRAAYIGAGKPVDKDFAPTPERADDIANRDAAAKLSEALQVQASRNEGALATEQERKKAPGKTGKSPVNHKTMQDSMLDALSGIPGATTRNVSAKGNIGNLEISDDVRDTLAQAGLYDRAEQAGGDTLQSTNGDENAARAAILSAINLPKGAKFKGGEPAKSGFFGFGAHPEVPAGFIGPDGQPIDLSVLAKAVALSPAAGAPAASPDDPVIANALPDDNGTPRAFQRGPSMGPPAINVPPAPGMAASSIPPPAQRVQNQVYQTPKGPMTWTGTGWRP